MFAPSDNPDGEVAASCSVVPASVTPNAPLFDGFPPGVL
jgi:hypothetical protein